jgi:hypothetical protein
LQAAYKLIAIAHPNGSTELLTIFMIKFRYKENLRGGTMLNQAGNDGKRGGTAVEDNWERRTSRGSPKETTTTPHHSKFADD